MAGSAFRVAGSRPPKALGGGVACRGPGGGVEEVSSATETAEEASSVAETIKEVLVEVIEEVSSTVETIEEVSSSAEAVAAVPADVIEVSSAAEAIKEVSLAAKSLAEVPTEAIEEVSWEAERIEEVSWEAEAVAAGPAEAMKETLSALQAIEEASSAAVAGTAVLTEAIEEASLVSEEASSMAKAIEEGSSAPKSLPEIWTAWIEKTSLAVEALEGGPAAVDLLPVVSTFEVWDPSTALEVCGSANPGGGDFAPPVQVHSIACLPTGLQLLLKNSCKLSINSSCDKQFPLVATNSPLSSAQNMTNELADGQRKFVLAEGSSKDLNNEAMQLSNGGMGCTEMLDKSHEQDSVPVRRVSRDLMKKIEALNMKTRRIAAQKVAAQVGCDEKGKCTEVANGKDSSSGITSYDAQSAKMKERARQRANELREEEEERKRTQKARAMVKLEELNMRRNNRDVPDQSKEQQVHHSYVMQEEEEERKRTQKPRAMVKLEELNMRWNNRDVPDQSKEQQVHHSYVKSSINRENWIDACDQRRSSRVYGSQLSETIFSQSRRGIDIDRKLPMFDARSSRMPSGKPSVGALPGSMPPRSSSRWIEKSYGEKAVGRTPRTRTAWVEKTMIGRSAPILPPQTTKTVWIEKRRDL